MSKQQFLEKYREQLLLTYAWAGNSVKLAKFMDGVRETLFTNKRIWSIEGEAVVTAWKSMGGKGKPTLKALRALP